LGSVYEPTLRGTAILPGEASNLVVYLASDESSFSKGAGFIVERKKKHDFCIFHVFSIITYMYVSIAKRVPGQRELIRFAVRSLKNGVADIGSVRIFSAHPRRHQKNPATAFRLCRPMREDPLSGALQLQDIQL
jgi:hypothetical protein